MTRTLAAVAVAIGALTTAAPALATLDLHVHHQRVSVRWIASTSYAPCALRPNKCGTSRVQLLLGGVVQGGRTFRCVRPRALVAGKYREHGVVGVFVRACGNIHRWVVYA